MPKMKTHKSTNKVLKVRPGGTISRGKSGARHNTGKKRAKYNRKKRKDLPLSKADEKKLKDIINK